MPHPDFRQLPTPGPSDPNLLSNLKSSSVSHFFFLRWKKLSRGKNEVFQKSACERKIMRLTIFDKVHPWTWNRYTFKIYKVSPERANFHENCNKGDREAFFYPWEKSWKKGQTWPSQAIFVFLGNKTDRLNPQICIKGIMVLSSKIEKRVSKFVAHSCVIVNR